MRPTLRSVSSLSGNNEPMKRRDAVLYNEVSRHRRDIETLYGKMLRVENTIQEMALARKVTKRTRAEHGRKCKPV